MKYVFQLHTHLANDLLAAIHVVFSVIAFEHLASTANGVALLVQQAANLSNHHHVTALIIAAISSSFDGLELLELLLPIPEDVDPAIKGVVRELASRLGAQLRG